METMEKILFETPKVFVPTEIQIDILRAVSDLKSCRIGDIVHSLNPARSESRVRSGVHTLLSRGYLDGGSSGSELVLRLTSRGRMLLLPGSG